MGVNQAEEEFRAQRLEMQELIQLAYEEKAENHSTIRVILTSSTV